MRNRSHVVVRAAAATAILITGSTAMAAVYYQPVATLVGDGTDTLSNNAALTTIQVYQDGVANQTSPVAQASYAASTSGLQTTGASGTEGQLANNPTVADNAATDTPTTTTAYVFSPGYSAAQNATNVNNAANANPRVVGYMTVTGNSVSGATIGSTDTNASTYPGGNIRGAVGTDNAGTLYAAGNAGGYHYMPAGTNQTSVGLVNNTPSNTRVVGIRNGQLYGTSDTGSFVGIQQVGTGLPTSGTNTATPIFTIGSSSAASPESSLMIDDSNKATPASDGAVSGFAAVPYNVIYVADAETGTVSGLVGPGIQKWVYSTANRANGNGGWSLAYTVADTSTVAGFNTPMISLTGQEDGNGNVLLYGATELFKSTGPGVTTTTSVTAAPNDLLEFTDSIDSGTAAITDASEVVLATSGSADDAFRGVALAPVPEPASLSLLTLGIAGLMSRRRRA